MEVRVLVLAVFAESLRVAVDGLRKAVEPLRRNSGFVVLNLGFEMLIKASLNPELTENFGIY
ncbi:hypothetical protein A6X21_17075 [Planctopirus hydrillae]|uniref:Uncharacterized protein n=1 Tax=Planctopirus hydrillae TaxID=1841610 RepID=A0A1C3EQI6_9PLAN|nr:hypothetical protein A6X21_17075 [Planctopirus hydrillae]